MPDLRDMTQLKRKREVEDEVEKGETSLEEECKRFRSQYVSPQVCISLCWKDPYLVLVFLSTCTGIPVRRVGQVGSRPTCQPDDQGELGQTFYFKQRFVIANYDFEGGKVKQRTPGR